ncbi:MAG: glycosyltransferase [Treponema sp.]|jgi:cellulose synthase/poly-beta-1,6-N-acetylglucosamine synthase-like glycosyltransferase|nr:glycosyltransferase [Treponema sp.]
MVLLLFNIFRFGFAAVFVALHAALMAGFVRERARDRRAAGKIPERDCLPRVSVIVPFHNESLRMEGLLRTLGNQNYPEAEYVFIDDRSTDDSPLMLARFTEGRKDCRVITLEGNPGPNHKQYAIGRGIEAAGGSLLLFTDADCEVPPGWIAAMAGRMADERVGVIIGPVFKKYGRGFFYFYQCIDHAIRYMYLAASTGLGAAGGGFGNNLILRRECLDLIGGYESVPLSPTEDAALVSRIRSISGREVRSAIGKDTHVFTRPEDSWAAFLNQTLRWNNGGLFSADPLTRTGFGGLMISISMGIIALPLLPFFPGLWPLPAAVLCSMIMNTAAVLGTGSVPPGNAAGYAVQLLFTPAWMTLLTILGFLGFRTDWKGSRFGDGDAPLM